MNITDDMIDRALRFDPGGPFWSGSVAPTAGAYYRALLDAVLNPPPHEHEWLTTDVGGSAGGGVPSITTTRYACPCGATKAVSVTEP